ncbi:MAG: helix-turn-helix domain-containing protein [Ignavibacteria bacterium]|nr:helix-turn-helix domain-containing protein [Ignavibacteria bacterium]
MILKQLRISLGLSQQQVADLLGVDVRTIKRWEADPNPPRRIKLLYASLRGDSEASGTEVVDGTVPMTMSSVIQHRPDCLELEGMFADFLGSLPLNRRFSILVGGASGAGKSSITLQITSALSRHGPVLYCSSEERIDTGTIGTRAEQVGVEDADIDVVEVSVIDDIRRHLSDGFYSYCVIDSINELVMSPAEAKVLMDEFPDVSFIFIAQADATEKATMGGARWRHLVDIRLWCEKDKEGRRIVRNVKNRFAPRVDELIVSGPSRPLSKPARGIKADSISPQDHKDDDMNDYSTWIITRLESDLATAHREIESLRTRLDDKNEQLRTIEMRLMRFEIEAESLANMEHEGGGLSDNLDPSKLIASLDKIAPIASVVGDLIRVFRPQASSQQVSAPFPQQTPPAFNTASPYDSEPTNFIPGVQQ